MYPNWLLRAGEAFEAAYADTTGNEGPVVLEDALLQAFSAATGVELKPHFDAELMLDKLRKALEEHRTAVYSKRYYDATALN